MVALPPLVPSNSPPKKVPSAIWNGYLRIGEASACYTLLYRIIVFHTIRFEVLKILVQFLLFINLVSSSNCDVWWNKTFLTSQQILLNRHKTSAIANPNIG